jgi:hypothetical protein
MRLARYVPPSIDLLECIGQSAGILTPMDLNFKRTCQGVGDSRGTSLLDDLNLPAYRAAQVKHARPGQLIPVLADDGINDERLRSPTSRATG